MGREAGGPRAVNRPVALAARRILKLLLQAPIVAWKGFRVDGGARLPSRRRPLVVCCNHAAFVDSIYLMLALRPRFVVCGAKPRLFRNFALRTLMAVANILEVEGREQYLADCGALLDAGEILLIYPEMGRFPDGLGDFKTWCAEVALASGAPLLPCYLYGTTRGQDGRPRLVVGEEFAATGDPESLTRRLRQEVAALAPAGALAAAQAQEGPA